MAAGASFFFLPNLGKPKRDFFSFFSGFAPGVLASATSLVFGWVGISPSPGSGSGVGDDGGNGLLAFN